MRTRKQSLVLELPALINKCIIFSPYCTNFCIFVLCPSFCYHFLISTNFSFSSFLSNFFYIDGLQYQLQQCSSFSFFLFFFFQLRSAFLYLYAKEWKWNGPKKRKKKLMKLLDFIFIFIWSRFLLKRLKMVWVVLVKTTSWNHFRTKMTNLELIHYMLSRFENDYKKRTQNDLSRFYSQKGLKKKKK
jgi:hypothetical protein